MKKMLLSVVAILFAATTFAQKNAPEDMVVIDDQPEGRLQIYERSGYLVREVEKDAADEANPYEIVRDRQTGTINMIFSNDGKVYMQHPVSWLTVYDGWIEGTLSSDGKTITMPMMQYIAYTESFDMAVQVAMFRYDSTDDTYYVDESISEITYTINDDGSITQNGTSRQLVLGAMNRAFGDTYVYLDKEWLGSGDYQSVYTPFKEEMQTPPANLETTNYYLTTAEYDGTEWKGYSSQVKLGFDGNDAWLQGLCKYLPQSWVKGSVDGDKITFPSSQFFGTFEQPMYFKGSVVVNNDVEDADFVMTRNDDGTYSSTDIYFITTDKDRFVYVNYYMGLTLATDPEQPIDMSATISTTPYAFIYRSNMGEDGAIIDGTTMVGVGFEGNNVYIKGLWDMMPDAWVVGRINGNKLTFDLSQYLGDVTMEYLGTYPIYLTAFDETTGVLQKTVTFDYDAATKTFTNNDYPLSMGINKTGFLGLQDFYNCQFLTEAMAIEGVTDNSAQSSVVEKIFTTDGRQVGSRQMQKGINIVVMSDGSVRKVVK